MRTRSVAIQAFPIVVCDTNFVFTAYDTDQSIRGHVIIHAACANVSL